MWFPFGKETWFILPTLVGSRGAAFNFLKSLALEICLPFRCTEGDKHKHTHRGITHSGGGCHSTAERKLVSCAGIRVRGNSDSNTASFININSSASSAKEGKTQAKKTGAAALCTDSHGSACAQCWALSITGAWLQKQLISTTKAEFITKLTQAGQWSCVDCITPQKGSKNKTGDTSSHLL